MDSPLRAAIYCRVSTEEQAREGFSIPAQKKTLVNFCNIRGWETVKIYTDEGISGKDTKRPAFQELLLDAANGLFDMVVVWKINRFSRKNSDLLNTVEYLIGYGVNLVSCCEQFDASTPSGRLMLSMLGTIGEFERETIVENIRSGMTERAEQGLFNGGRVLGYDARDGRLAVNECEAKIVRKIFELYLNGYGYKNIADILEKQGHRTKTGCSFNTTSIKRILKNPIYAGRITYNRTKKNGRKVLKCSSIVNVPGQHEPIISPEEFENVQESISSKKQIYTNLNSYILSPVLKCPLCGGKMTGHTTHSGNSKLYRYYVCLKYKNHGPSSFRPCCINADEIENAVIDYMCSIIMYPGVVQDVSDKLKGFSFEEIAVILENFKCIFPELPHDTQKRLISSFLKEVTLTEDKKLRSIVLNFNVQHHALHRS